MRSAEFAPATVLVTGARAPAALHAARLFHLAGARVIAADSNACPLTRADRRHYETRRFPAPASDPGGFTAWVRETCVEERVDLIFPTCEEVFHLAAALRGTPLEGCLYAPHFDLLLEAHSKVDFPHMLDRIGLAAPRTERITSQGDVDNLRKEGRDIVLKPEFSRFATHALVRPEPGDLASVRPAMETPWALQEALEGPEVCLYGIAAEGALKGIAAYRPKYRAGRGAGTYFEPYASTDLMRYASAFASRTGWTGQFAMDVILTGGRGPVAIECNPRATSGIHFFGDGGRFAEAVSGQGFAWARLRPKMISSVVWTHGFLGAVAGGGIGAWLGDVRRAEDALRLGPFRAPLGAMLRSSAEFARAARQGGISVLEATTKDIAWDG